MWTTSAHLRSVGACSRKPLLLFGYPPGFGGFLLLSLFVVIYNTFFCYLSANNPLLIVSHFVVSFYFVCCSQACFRSMSITPLNPSLNVSLFIYMVQYQNNGHLLYTCRRIQLQTKQSQFEMVNGINSYFRCAKCI